MCHYLVYNHIGHFFCLAVKFFSKIKKNSAAHTNISIEPYVFKNQTNLTGPILTQIDSLLQVVSI